MKLAKKLFVTAVALAMVISCFTALAVSASDNLFTNPGFENGTTGWTITGNGTVDTTTVKEGTKSLKIENTNDADVTTVAQTITVTKNKFYYFTADFNLTQMGYENYPAGAGRGFRMYNSADVAATATDLFRLTGQGWRGIMSNCPANFQSAFSSQTITSVTVTFELRGKGTVYIDNTAATLWDETIMEPNTDLYYMFSDSQPQSAYLGATVAADFEATKGNDTYGTYTTNAPTAAISKKTSPAWVYSDVDVYTVPAGGLAAGTYYFENSGSKYEFTLTSAMAEGKTLGFDHVRKDIAVDGDYTAAIECAINADTTGTLITGTTTKILHKFIFDWDPTAYPGRQADDSAWRFRIGGDHFFGVGGNSSVKTAATSYAFANQQNWLPYAEPDQYGNAFSFVKTIKGYRHDGTYGNVLKIGEQDALNIRTTNSACYTDVNLFGGWLSDKLDNVYKITFWYATDGAFNLTLNAAGAIAANGYAQANLHLTDKTRVGTAAEKSYQLYNPDYAISGQQNPLFEHQFASAASGDQKLVWQKAEFYFSGYTGKTAVSLRNYNVGQNVVYIDGVTVEKVCGANQAGKITLGDTAALTASAGGTINAEMDIIGNYTKTGTGVTFDSGRAASVILGLYEKDASGKLKLVDVSVGAGAVTSAAMPGFMKTGSITAADAYTTAKHEEALANMSNTGLGKKVTTSISVPAGANAKDYVVKAFGWDAISTGAPVFTSTIVD